MSERKEQIRTELVKLSKKSATVQTFAGTVVEVDEKNYTCDVDPGDGSPIYHDVRLKAAIDSEEIGLIIIPEVKSDVLVGSIDNDNTYKYITKFGKIKRYLIKTKGGGTFEIDAKGIVKLNGETFGGLVKVEALTKRINTLEGNYNDLLDALRSISIALAPTGTYPLAPSFATMTSIVKTKKSDLENENVKHG